MPSAALKFSESPLLCTAEVFEKLLIHEGKRIDDVLKHVVNACKEETVANGMIKELPSLTGNTLTTIQDGTLVRYRCMIQDMRELEFFQSVYSTTDGSKPDEEQLHCSLWQETLEIPEGREYCDEGPRHETSERQVFVGSSIPAETSWSRWYPGNGSASSLAEGKVQIGDGQLPVAQCLLKVYLDGDRVKLNDVVDFVGIYYAPGASPPAEDANQTASIAGNNGSMRAEVVEPKLLPCLHVVYFEKLTHHHPELSLPNGSCEEHQGRCQLVRSLGGNITCFRARLVDAFKENLFKGDELVSEYFLCHLMSSIYARDIGTPVGQFALNIFNVDSVDFGSGWAETRLRPFLEQLLTQVAYLPLSLSTLNHASLVSRKCYETDRLISGRLQLPKGTELIIDETKLDAGRLDTQGVKNIAALRGIIKWQKLDYDFGYNTFEFSTDLRALVISEGPSVLPSDFALPVRAHQMEPLMNAEPKSPISEDKEFLEAARVYFALAPTLAFTIDEAMQTRVQEDFVAMRRDSNGGVTGDHLHRLLTVARMLSLSSGDSHLRLEIWEKAKRMEAERLERLKK